MQLRKLIPYGIPERSVSTIDSHTIYTLRYKTVTGAAKKIMAMASLQAVVIGGTGSCGMPLVASLLKSKVRQ